MTYKPRGTRTRRRLQAFREASQARRAVALAQAEPVRVDLSQPFSVVDALLAMSAERDAALAEGGTDEQH